MRKCSTSQVLQTHLPWNFQTALEVDRRGPIPSSLGEVLVYRYGSWSVMRWRQQLPKAMRPGRGKNHPQRWGPCSRLSPPHSPQSLFLAQKQLWSVQGLQGQVKVQTGLYFSLYAKDKCLSCGWTGPEEMTFHVSPGFLGVFPGRALSLQVSVEIFNHKCYCFITIIFQQPLFGLSPLGDKGIPWGSHAMQSWDHFH